MKFITLFALQVLLISLYAAKVDDERWQLLNEQVKRPQKKLNNDEYDDDADFYRRYDFNNYEDISPNAIEAAGHDLLLDSINKSNLDHSDEDYPLIDDTKGVVIKAAANTNKPQASSKITKSNDVVVRTSADENPTKSPLDVKNDTENLKLNNEQHPVTLTRTPGRKPKLPFSYNVQCTMSDVLCFIVNWNDTIIMLLEHPLFRECFGLKNESKPIARHDHIELLNTLKQLSKAELIDNFVATVEEGNVFNEKTQHEHLHANCSNIDVNNFLGGNLKENLTNLPVNVTKPQERLHLDETLKLANALNEQLNCEQNATGLDAQIASLRKHVAQIMPIFDLTNATDNNNTNTTSLIPTVKDVQDLILLSQQQKKCDDLCCDKCLAGLHTLRTSANSTIHQLHQWTADSFKLLHKWYANNSNKLGELLEAASFEQKRSEINDNELRAIKQSVHELGDNQEAINVKALECCTKFDEALADKLANASDVQKDENERLNKQIDDLKKTLDELTNANANQVKDAAAEVEKLKNLADQLKAQEDTFKRSDGDNKDEIRTMTTKIEHLNTSLKEIVDNPKYQREFDEQLKKLTDELKKLKAESAENENQLHNKINELETNLMNANETIAASQQQMQQRKAENEEQTKHYEELQHAIGELQNNTIKPYADKLANVEEQIRNVSQKQTECCTKTDERINDIMNTIRLQVADLKRLQESLNQDRNARDEHEAKAREDARKWETQFEKITKNMEDIKSQCEKETDNIKAKLEDLTKNLVNEAKLNETVQSCNDKLEQLRNEYEREMAGLKAANESAVKRIESLEKQLGEVTASKTNSNDDDELRALKARLDQLEENSCKNCEAESKKLHEHVNRLEKRVDELEEKLANMGNNNNNNNNYNANDSESCGEVQMEINEDLNQRMFLLEQNYGDPKQYQKSGKQGPVSQRSNPTKYPAKNFKRDQKLGMYFNKVV